MMPIISVTMLEGRDIQKKRALIRELTDGAIRSLGVKPEQVRVLLHELPLDDFAVAGVSFGEKAENESNA